MSKNVEGWKIGSSYHVDEQGRLTARITNLGVPASDWWHVESFDPTTGHNDDDDYCYSFQEAVELANYFVKRQASNV